MECTNIPVMGFDEDSFRQEFTIALVRGAMEMKKNKDDVDAFIASYNSMSDELKAVIKQHNPPEAVLQEVNEDKRAIVEGIVAKYRVRIDQVYNVPIKKTCSVILGSIDTTVVRLGKPDDLALDALISKGFEPLEAKRLLGDLCTLECSDIYDLIGKASRRLRFERFLGFLAEHGKER